MLKSIKLGEKVLTLFGGLLPPKMFTLVLSIIPLYLFQNFLLSKRKHFKKICLQTKEKLGDVQQEREGTIF